MSDRALKLNPLNAYVSAVIAVGMLCAAGLVHDGWGDMHRLLSPEALMFFAFAFCGEFVTLKVITRGAEGEVTTSTTFALAAMLVAGPLAGLVALVVANLFSDTLQRKSLQKKLFNLCQYAFTVGATGLVLKPTTGTPRMDAPHLSPWD